MTINENDFRRIDLNLLVVFNALLAERSVSGAARRLYLGQPAVSAALKRLRDLFDDELFVRTGRAMEPTERALSIADPIRDSLATIQATISKENRFEPARTSRVFRIGTVDAIEVALLPTLMKELESAAPGIQLVVREPSGQTAAQALDDEQIDIAIAPFQSISSWHRQREVYSFVFVAMFDGERLGIEPPITMDQYLAHPHLLTSFNGDLRGFVDDHLRPLGKSRHVVMSSSHFGTLPIVLKNTATIATLPSNAASMYTRQIGLTISPLPFPVSRVPVSIIWHARSDKDPAMQFMVDTIARCSEQMAEPLPAGVQYSPEQP